MKMYIILLKDRDIDSYEAVSSYGIDGMAIYAVTNKKEFLKRFIETRDMDKFIVKKLDVTSEDAYNKFLDDNDIGGCDLVNSSFPTTIVYDDNYCVGYVNVICTVNESDNVEYDYSEYVVENVQNIIDGIYDFIYKSDRSKPNGPVSSDEHTIEKYLSIFNKEIRDSLEFLGFSQIIEDTMYQLDAYDSSEVELGEDKLRIYCKKYANTYKKDFKI